MNLRNGKCCEFRQGVGSWHIEPLYSHFTSLDPLYMCVCIPSATPNDRWMNWLWCDDVWFVYARDFVKSFYDMYLVVYFSYIPLVRRSSSLQGMINNTFSKESNDDSAHFQRWRSLSSVYLVHIQRHNGNFINNTNSIENISLIWIFSAKFRRGKTRSKTETLEKCV